MLLVVHQLVLMSFLVGSDYINLSKSASAFIFSDILSALWNWYTFYWFSLVCEV